MYSILKSIRTTNFLLAALMGLLVYGAVAMPLSPSFRSLSSTALFDWMKTAPLTASWWLYGCVAVLFLLAVNTVLCSIESVLRKRKGRQWLLTTSPQVIHAGFCFILVAHLLSSYGSFHKHAVLYEGYGARMESGVRVHLKEVKSRVESGHVTDMKATVVYTYPDGSTKEATVSPNNPAFVDGTGLYLKRVTTDPVPAALVLFSYDPGALPALIGGVLFITGILTLVVLKLQDKDRPPADTA
ncbi:MAG TPA: hypothetical protein ENJ04_01925 [Nitrospirae bacterium]|nr:hypothetical protein [Nitrospirota bacterium]